MPSLRALGLGLAILVQLMAAKPVVSQAVAATDYEPSSITKPVGSTPALPLTGGKLSSTSPLNIQTNVTR
jgi:hypothetical protein